MKSGYGNSLGSMAILIAVVLLAVVAGACSSGNDKTIDLLNDPKIGLSHLNDEFHTIKGEDLLANPQYGLAHLNEELHLLKDPKVGVAHLNDELHTVRVLATDPKVGFEHLNDEFHTIKQLLADLTKQVESLKQGAQ